ncbi:MAG: hypothetical protein ACI9WS_001102 [Paraglaciecola psychrophila]|jgi:hypothetical protein
MNTHRFKMIALAMTVSCGAFLGATAQANTADAVLTVGQAKTAAASKSQQSIDKLASETGDLLQDYKTVMKVVDGLRVYNERLEKQIANQLARVASIDTSIGQVTVIQRQVTPLVIRMIDGLEKFVNLDVPFRIEERQERVAFLRANVDRSDLSVAEKFRQVLEAYKIENQYGRKVDAYKGSISINGSEREVNFFRVGRIALLYQTTDTLISGAWDKNAGQFVELDPGEYRNAIIKGLRIARQQATVDILKLPIPAPEAAK